MVQWFIEQGRLGGLLLVLVASACFGVAWWDHSQTGGFFIIFPAIGVATGLFGAMLLVMGSPYSRRLRKPPKSKLDKEALAEILTHPRPFYYCTSCLTFNAISVCDTCDRVVDIVTVRNSDDMRILMAALNVDLPSDAES